MKIALDAMGGDHAPMVNIVGAKDALALYPKITKLFLVGDEDTLKASCKEHGLTDQRVEIIHASQVVEMHESGAKTLRSKKDSSISVATSLVKSGDADAVISAGNTGAAVAAATLKLRTLKGVERAGIASPIPNEHGICNLLDAGANPEAKPEHLVTYAVMGSIYAKQVIGVKDPIVGLMSNGEEDEKGTTFTKETFALLRQLEATGKAPFKFKGNVEGHDLFQTKLDVILTDGFTGNIILKTCEATAKAMSKWLKLEFKRSPFRLLGAAMAKGAFKSVKERSSYESYGGSPLLGVNGVCIIAHGGSSALAMQNAIRVGMETVEQGVNPHIEEALAALQ
ncbi:phosphate:acyl-[acyl carrier protein] acyltransferase [Rubritalea squalenifaciens DSM 18772]|uniref:Phosphate acyltransferase n=1 Tax=Rubritalea squalenifaciens DSM 18772 TaxID=1123071 RepID=A0A1M6MBP7_9BACT|nr:phosphate acyltransferase PlsX [Rubritalea squalenifaciens]SHJ80938.1 phosphate:acyl-[acyl carrier protein] acyltransferase [Rubritalea squalenifaciens DSM 18772]